MPALSFHEPVLLGTCVSNDETYEIFVAVIINDENFFDSVNCTVPDVGAGTGSATSSDSACVFLNPARLVVVNAGFIVISTESGSD